MADDNTEADEVRIEIDGIQQECDVLANSLATFGPLDSWPRFLWNHSLSPDATPDGLYMVRRFDPMPLPTPTGQHIKLYGPPRGPQDAAQGPGGAFISTTPAIEIDLSPIDGKHCTLRARADGWAGSMLVHMLLHSGEERDRAVWSTVCAAFPVLYEAFNRIRKLLFNPVKIILSYVNTDADSMSRWLVRNTDFAFLHHQRENDGGQTWLTPGLANRSEKTENGLTFFDRTVRVGAWLISRPDTRGILGAAYVGDMVRFRIEDLSAHRCKVEALLSDERFSNFFDGLHANLADDYPETQKAIEAAGINLDRNKYRKPDTPQAAEPTDASPPPAAPKHTRKRARTKSADPRAVVAKFKTDRTAGKVDTMEAWAAREGIAYKTLNRYINEIDGNTGIQD